MSRHDGGPILLAFDRYRTHQTVSNQSRQTFRATHHPLGSSQWWVEPGLTQTIRLVARHTAFPFVHFFTDGSQVEGGAPGLGN